MHHLTASAARDMVGFVYGKMIYASKDVEQASRLVLCGFRDWAKLNRWQRINVSCLFWNSLRNVLAY